MSADEFRNPPPPLDDIATYLKDAGQRFARWMASQAGYVVCSGCKDILDTKDKATCATFIQWQYAGADGWRCTKCKDRKD